MEAVPLSTPSEMFDNVYVKLGQNAGREFCTAKEQQQLKIVCKNVQIKFQHHFPGTYTLFSRTFQVDSHFTALSRNWEFYKNKSRTLQDFP